nr:hypothetical protein [Tanacetum cinerariifolium]
MRTNPLLRLGEGIYTLKGAGHVGLWLVQHSLGPLLGPFNILRALALILWNDRYFTCILHKCLHIYVNGKIPRGKKQTAKVSVKEIQKNYQPKIAKPKKIGTRESLATPKPSKFRLILRWSPTGKLFDTGGKIVDYRESKSTSDCSNGDNACTSNTMEPKIKRFPNSTSLLGRLSRFVCGTSTQVVPST